MQPLASIPSMPIASSNSWLITPNVGLMIWTFVVFAISLYILIKAVFPRIRDALDERRREHRRVDRRRRAHAPGGRPDSWPNTASA